MRFKLLLFGALLLFCSACDPPKDAKVAVPYLPAAELVLQGVAVGAGPGVASAVESGSLSRCLTWVVARNVAVNAGGYLRDVEVSGEWLAKLPAMEIVYLDCMPLAKEGRYVPVIPERAGPLVNGVAKPLLSIVRVQVERAVGDSSLVCPKKELLLALAPYLEGAVTAVLDELSNPDGRIVVPEATLGVCPATAAAGGPVSP